MREMVLLLLRTIRMLSDTNTDTDTDTVAPDVTAIADAVAAGVRLG